MHAHLEILLRFILRTGKRRCKQQRYDAEGGPPHFNSRVRLYNAMSHSHFLHHLVISGQTVITGLQA